MGYIDFWKSALFGVGAGAVVSIAFIASIAAVVSSFDVVLFEDDAERDMYATALATLLAFLTTGLINASNGNNGKVRAQCAALFGSIGMFSTLLANVVDVPSCLLEMETVHAYLRALVEASVEKTPGASDGKVGKTFAEAVKQIRIMNEKSGSNADTFKLLLDRIAATKGHYGTLTTIRGSGQPPPLVFGFWLVTGLFGATVAMAVKDSRPIGRVVLAAVLTCCPALGLYVASAPDPLARALHSVDLRRESREVLRAAGAALPEGKACPLPSRKAQKQPLLEEGLKFRL